MSFDKKSPSNELQSFEGPNTPESVSMHTQYMQNTGDFTSKDQPRRINPDSHKMLWIAVGLVGFVGAISFMVSFAGLVAVAEWAGLPPAMRWAVPIFIDAAILVYSIAVLIHRSRGEKTWASWTSLAAFTLVSVLANVGHVLLMPERSTNEFQTLIGALVAGMAPIGVFAATEELGRMAIARPSRRQAPDNEPVQFGEDRPNTTPPTTRPDTGTTTRDRETTPVVAASEPVAESVNAQASTNPATAREVQEFTQLPFNVDTENLVWGHTHTPNITGASAPQNHATPRVAQNTTAPVRDAIPVTMDTMTEDRPRPMNSIRYIDPADGEDQILNDLLTRYGKGLTAKHIAESLGKSIRTGQRKFAKMQQQHPETLSAADQKES
ncbi:DUF2637 domain-containing protein [Glutamicibacter ardleyensis]|uniref:DUF2637 domain-containing protein n=1 Tax=Glutamicibacter ardleyensis TaxID=225894 RepID=UPI003FD21B34